MFDFEDHEIPSISNPELNGKSWVLGSKLETYPNPDYLGIHTRAPLCKKGQWYSDHYTEKLNEFPILTQALIQSLESVPGITEVQVRPYRVSLLRSQCYSWQEILEKALPFFVSYLPANY